MLRCDRSSMLKEIAVDSGLQKFQGLPALLHWEVLQQWWQSSFLGGRHELRLDGLALKDLAWTATKIHCNMKTSAFEHCGSYQPALMLAFEGRCGEN